MPLGAFSNINGLSVIKRMKSRICDSDSACWFILCHFCTRKLFFRSNFVLVSSYPNEVFLFVSLIISQVKIFTQIMVIG